MVVCNNLQLVLERKLMVVYNLLPVLARRLMVIMMYNLPVSEKEALCNIYGKKRINNPVYKSTSWHIDIT